MLPAIRAAIAAIFLVAVTAACSQNKQVTAEDVETMIAAELPQGSDRAAVEAFFERHGLAYSYDRFAKRYQSIIREVSPRSNRDQAIVIYLYVDDANGFTAADVRNSFTAP